MKRIFLLFAAVLLLTAQGAWAAGNRAGAFTISPVIGGYTFADAQHRDTTLVYGGRFGYNLTENIGIEGLFDAVNAKSNNGAPRADLYRYGGEFLYHFLPKGPIVPYLAAGAGGLHMDGGTINNGTKLMVDYGGGLKWFLADFFAMRADVRGINYTYGSTYTNVEYTLGALFQFGGNKPAPKPLPPEPVKEVEKPKAAPVEIKPAPTANLAASPSSIEKGKSVTLTWDSQNATGCEIQPDVGPVPPKGSKEVMPASDTSYTLVCKGDGGSASSSAKVDVTLPPPPPKVEEASAKKASAAGTRLTLNVQFDTNKSDIKKKYYDELKKVGDVLNQEKNIKGVIEGHTDNVGSDASNMKLSQRRANAVRNYIVTKFKVDRKRLSAKGFGESKPIADNATAEGRQQNRRIDAVFEEIPNFKPDADEQPVPVKKAVKKKVAKKKAVKK